MKAAVGTSKKKKKRRRRKKWACALDEQKEYEKIGCSVVGKVKRWSTAQVEKEDEPRGETRGARRGGRRRWKEEEQHGPRTT